MAPKKTAQAKTPTPLPTSPAPELAGAAARPAAVRRRVAAAPTAATSASERPTAPAPRKTAPVRRVAKAPVASVQATEPARAAAPRPTVTNEDIQVRAYFLALEHGGKGGNLDFWLLAERELRAGAASRD